MHPRLAISILALLLLVAATEATTDDGASAPAPTPAPPTPAPAASPLSLTTTFDAELLRDLPGSRRPWAILETSDATAILDRIDNGGLYTGEPELLGIHGASWTQTSYQLGDLDITDPVFTGTPLFLPDPGAFEAVGVASGLLPVELGGQGPVLTFVPRRPGNSWHGTVAGDWLPAGLQSSEPNGPPAIARYNSLAGGRFRMDGPLVKDRLGLLLSANLDRVRRLQRADPTVLEGIEAGLLAHVVWTPPGKGEFRLLGGVQSVEHPYPGRARFGGGDVRQSDRFSNVQASWERHGGTRWTVGAGYSRGTFLPDLSGRTAGSTVERLRDGPVPLLFNDQSTRERGTIGAGLEHDAGRFLGGRHALGLGASAAWSRATTTPAEPRTLTPETVNGLPARLWDHGWGDSGSRWRAFDLAAYAADRARFGRISVDAGLRFELTRASAQAAPVDIRWSALSPRLSARADLTEGGGLAFLAGYARYRHRLPLSWLAYGDPAAPGGRVYRWLDGNADGVFDPGEQGPLVARVGPGGSLASIDPGLRPPRTNEFVLGLEARLGERWTASLIGIHRRERDLVASVNTGAPPSAYSVIFLADPGGDILGPADDQLLPVYDRRPESFSQDRYVLSNLDDNALHEGVEIALRGRLGERLRVLFGGTASRSVGRGGNRGFRATENDQGLLGERLENPNAATDSRGRLFFDRAFTLKLAAAYRAPGDLRLAAIARYQDGRPFSRLVIAEGLSQGPDPVQAIPNGRSRFAYTLTVDARLEKGFVIGGARVAAALEVFNLLDMAQEVEEDVTTGSQFRAVTAVQPPRAFVFEFRADF